MKKFNRNRQVFCSILTNRCCSAVGTVFDADTIIFYDTDLNPSMDARTQEWCDKIGRSKDIHIYRWYYKNRAFWFCFIFLCSLFCPQIKQFYLFYQVFTEGLDLRFYFLLHVPRLESGNSIEEKLLKNGTKDLIREVAAQGTDYTLAFLTQVR